MKKSRYTEEQIIGILKQHEAGLKTADLCREHGIRAAVLRGVVGPVRQRPQFAPRIHTDHHPTR